MKKNQVGLIGLAVMGQNFALNFANHGIAISVYNRSSEVTKEFINKNSDNSNLHPTFELSELVESLEIPRKIILLVKINQRSINKNSFNQQKKLF